MPHTFDELLEDEDTLFWIADDVPVNQEDCPNCGSVLSSGTRCQYCGEHLHD